MNRLEGANCADLPPFVIDKYFDCDAQKDRLLAMVAKAICEHCVVRDACREEALHAPQLPDRGVVGGVSATEVRRARAWRRYELGLTDAPPRVTRPDWLTRPEAAETIEQGRVEEDPDEGGFIER